MHTYIIYKQEKNTKGNIIMLIIYAAFGYSINFTLILHALMSICV